MTTATDQSLRHQAFDRLKAELEIRWLDRVFVEPPDFEAMAGMRSMVVFGSAGAGKTALRMTLARRVVCEDAVLAPLVVEWHPMMPTDPALSGTRALRVFMAQALDACAQALLRYLGRRPEVFGAAPEWAQETAIWFVHQYLSGDRAVLLGKLAEQCKPAGMSLLRDLISREPRPVLEPDQSEARVIAELAGLTEYLELAGVWVLIDGLEPWIEADPAVPTRMLDTLFSTLALFEDPGFAMKIVAPNTIEAALASSGGIARRRLDVYRLEYTAEHLIAIAERRIAAAAGRETFRMAELCDSKELVAWLRRCGGHEPRAWLNLLRPLADAYLTGGLSRPLTLKECAEIFRRHPPILRLDLAAERVFVGDGELASLSSMSYKLLCYLYTQRRRCTRSELYYLVSRSLDAEPRTHEDHGWEDPSSWSETFDTILWRLRKQIELDLKTPLYIITDRGKGVRLENAW